MIRNIITAAALTVGVLASGANAMGEDTTPKWMTTPCEYEDSTNCYWDASANGLNGKGHSFYAVRVGKQDCLLFWDMRYARKHNRCVDR